MLAINIIVYFESLGCRASQCHKNCNLNDFWEISSGMENMLLTLHLEFKILDYTTWDAIFELEPIIKSRNNINGLNSTP